MNDEATLQDQEAADGSSPPPSCPAVAANPEGSPHALPRAPVHVRSAWLVVLGVLPAVAVLKWAAAFFIPLMLGFLLSCALAPIVNALQRVHIPRSLSAGVLIASLLAGAGASIYAFSDDANALIESLAEAAARLLRDAIHKRTSDGAPLDRVQKAAQQLEQAAAEAGSRSTPARDSRRLVIEQPHFDIREHLWNGTLGLASLIGQCVAVTFLTYFLLLSGDTFRRKLAKIAGPGLSSRKLTVRALDEITAQIQRYLLLQVFTSAVVGVATGVSFWALGLNHATVWGFAAGVLNLIPYIGSAVVAGGAALVAFMQFGEIDGALYVAAASLAIHAVMSNLLAPWLTSRASRMNPVAVFVGVLAWSWLWGVWGLVLGIPILMIVKAVCDRVNHLKPVGELLGV